MSKVTGICIIVVLLAGSMITNSPKAQSDLKDIVLERKLKMKSMLSDYFPLLATSKGKNTDLGKAAESARNLKDVFINTLPLFVEGTAKGEAPGSRAKAEIWTNPSEFNRDAQFLISSVSKLIELLESKNIEGFTEQFPTFEKACIGCHEFKPSGGGKFRFAK